MRTLSLHHLVAPDIPAAELVRILALIPTGLPVSLETPSERWRAQGASAGERARRVVSATWRLLAQEPA